GGRLPIAIIPETSCQPRVRTQADGPGGAADRYRGSSAGRPRSQGPPLAGIAAASGSRPSHVFPGDGRASSTWRALVVFFLDGGSHIRIADRHGICCLVLAWSHCDQYCPVIPAGQEGNATIA